MKVVIDTNCIAYLLLGTKPFAHEISKFLNSDVTLYAPDLWRAEVGNVLWQSVKGGYISEIEALKRFEYAENLIDITVSSSLLLSRALRLAAEKDHSVYDTLFVTLAAKESVTLITYDKKIRARFPEIARKPSLHPS